MKKAFLIFISFFFISIFSFGQIVAVSADRNNILYLDMDNPITIAAENSTSQSLVVNIDNGEISGQNGLYNCRPKSIGPAIITVSIKQDGKLKLIATKTFRAKYYVDVNNIQFYIGNCSNNCTISKATLKTLQYLLPVANNFYLL